VTSIIEPLMIVVGGIILAMYLPMFKIYELIE
jgi:type IV pilus assembly protein PilC